MKEITRTPQSRPAKKDRNLTRWLFVAPAMLVVLCLLVYPLCSTLLYSFTNKTLIKSTYAFKGIDNYIKIFADPAFGKAFLTTLVWTFFSLTGQILIGFSAALALNRIRNPIARPIYRICMIIPWAFPSIAIALVWKWMLNGIQGYIPTMLMKLGLSDGMLQFLSDPKLVLPTLVFINIWFGAPMIMVNVYAALSWSFPPSSSSALSKIRWPAACPTALSSKNNTSIKGVLQYENRRLCNRRYRLLWR